MEHYSGIIIDDGPEKNVVYLFSYILKNSIIEIIKNHMICKNNENILNEIKRTDLWEKIVISELVNKKSIKPYE